MIVKSLGNTDFKIIMECFLEAFENYFVEMPKDHNYYRQRWKAANVNYNLSYGMFGEERLVGFIINAVEERDDNIIAYNSGTGVIPEYRGQKIVKSIYEYAIPDLKKKGVTKCTLEVITDNAIAIKSYEGIGFKKVKHLKCYNGTITIDFEDDFTVSVVNYKDIDWSLIPNQDYYSWDNHRFSLNRGDYNFYQVKFQNELDSFFAINPNNGYLAQLEVLNTTETSWKRLVSAVHSISKTIKINNVDNRQTQKIKTLEDAGLKNSINQFEMYLNIA